MQHSIRLAFVVVVLAGLSRHALAVEQPLTPEELAALTIEELMALEVRMVARRPQPISHAAAAVTVITDEDIQRSGMTTIPDLLRLAPGVHVAQVNANRWAITSRGFNDVYANKLLVLMDGRTVYTPLFSGVYWDTVDYVIPDLDRIEVIRGPGATLWGANAVNGIINITTRSARDTQGVLLQGLAGNVHQIGAVRYGDQLDDNTWYRIYTKYRRTDDFKHPLFDPEDGGQLGRAGFRIDRDASPQDLLTLQGDLYYGHSGQPLLLPSFTPPFREFFNDEADVRGGNVLARWTRTISRDSELSVQFYYDYFNRDDRQIGYRIDTLDLEMQHRFPLSERHLVTWGLNTRFMFDRIDNSDLIVLSPTRRDDYIVGGFIQDEITLVPDRWSLILGTKVDLNSYTDLEVQPNARLLWTPSPRSTVWAAVSRAVRTPSRWEHDAAAIIFERGPTALGPPFELVLTGDRGFKSEELIAYELGYRREISRAMLVDLALFYNNYSNLRNAQVFAPTPVGVPPTNFLVPATINNLLEGDTYGAEVALTYNVSPDLRLVGAYTFLNVNIFRNQSTNDLGNQQFLEGADPRHQFQIRAHADITRTLEFNAALYYVDGLGLDHVPSYARLDFGVTWRPRENLEISAMVQNALDDRHREFDNRLNNVATEIPRAFYFQLVWRH